MEKYRNSSTLILAKHFFSSLVHQILCFKKKTHIEQPQTQKSFPIADDFKINQHCEIILSEQKNPQVLSYEYFS